MNCQIWSRAALAAALAFFAAGVVQAQTVTVEIEFAAGAAVSETSVRDALAGAPAHVVVASGRTITVETDTAGYSHLLANAAIRSARVVSGAPLEASRGDQGPLDLMQFRVRLSTSAPGGDQAIEGAALRGASHAAQLISRRAANDAAPPASPFGPGKLMVRGLNAGGREVARSVIDDPRLVRYEARNADDRLTGRRDFYRRDVELAVALPNSAIAVLSISAPDGAGGERELARVAVR
jgi:hypothetical protein